MTVAARTPSARGDSVRCPRGRAAGSERAGPGGPTIRLIAVVTAGVLSACGTLSTRRVDADRVHLREKSISEEVDALAKPLLAEAKTPGVVVGVLLPDGSTRFWGYGSIDAAGDPSPGPDTIFPVGSLTKGFVGAIAATLVEEGRLSWSDTLAMRLPPGTKLSPDAARITLGQLASHTSGLPRQPLGIQMLGTLFEFLFTGENFYKHMDRAAVLGTLSDFEALATPAPRYSNVGYAILGYVIERVTGRSLEALLAERLGAPLALEHTSYVPESLPGHAVRARGHVGDQPKFIRRGAAVPDWRFDDFMRGAAGLYSTARDLLQFARAHLHGGEGSLGRALAHNLRAHDARRPSETAISWTVDDVHGIRIAYQVGMAVGHSSYMGLDTASGTAVVVLQNAFNWDYSVGHTLMVALAEACTAPGVSKHPGCNLGP